MTEFYPAGLPTPRPSVDPATQPYWNAAERGELVVPYCDGCELLFWYPRGFCPRCGDAAVSWRSASGRGEVYSFSVVRRAAGPWAEHTPFVLAFVTLDEGVTVQANVVDCPADRLAPGLRVSAVFERADTEDLPVLRFVPLTDEKKEQP
ncbi:Zn-ribbon domain-containing OB-fold protein [Aeromicrobium sp. P5_D10]